MSKSNREFNCTARYTDKLIVSGPTNSGNLRVRIEAIASCSVFLSQGTCIRLVEQLQSFIDTGALLPDEPPEATSDAKATAKALLAAVGLEVEPNQIRVIQEASEESE